MVLFWFSNGDKTWRRHSLQNKLKNYFNRRGGVIKYMFATEIKNGDVAAAEKLLKNFVKAIPEEFIL